MISSEKFANSSHFLHLEHVVLIGDYAALFAKSLSVPQDAATLPKILLLALDFAYFAIVLML